MQVQKTFMQVQKSCAQIRLNTFMQAQKTFMQVLLKIFMQVQKTFIYVSTIENIHPSSENTYMQI